MITFGKVRLALWGVTLLASMPASIMEFRVASAKAPMAPSVILFCTQVLFWCRPPDASSGRPYYGMQIEGQSAHAFAPPEPAILWTRFKIAPASAAEPPVPRRDVRVPETAKGRLAKLRAGVIEDSGSSPDFPTVIPGTAVWAVSSSEPGSVVVDIDIGAGQSGMRLVFRVVEQSGQLSIDGELKGKLAKSDIQILEMPRARRTGAIEGEPLAGRVTMTEPGKFVIELTPEGRDKVNNWRRLTQSPWLDFRVGPDQERPIIITIEKGRLGNDLIADTFKDLRPH